jgi:hypothetical protein
MEPGSKGDTLMQLQVFFNFIIFILQLSYVKYHKNIERRSSERRDSLEVNYVLVLVFEMMAKNSE